MEKASQDEAIRVFLAISAPLPRARLRNVLMETDGVEIIGEAGSGALAAERSVDSKPDIMLIDERILADEAIELFSRMQGTPPACRFVLMAPNPQAVAYRGSVPVAGIVPLDSSGRMLRERLNMLVPHGHLEPRAPTAPRVAGMENRFVVSHVTRTAGDAEQQARNAPSNEVAPTRDLTQPPSGADLLVTRRLDGGGRRQITEAGTRLSMRLAATQLHLEQQRDSVTGLYNTKVLGGSLRALPEVGYQAAVFVVHFWYASHSGTPVDRAIDAEVVRAAAAVLKNNVRFEDVVCRLEGVSFAVVMPGITAATAPAAVRRVLSAMNRLGSTHPADQLVLQVAHGIGYWIPPMSAAEPLDQAWRSMVADRNAHSGV